VARNAVRGNAVAEVITKAGGNAIFVPCDVSKAVDCQRAVQKTLETFGGLGILFNNAGIIYPDKAVHNMTEEEWDNTLDINVKGMYLMSKYAIPHMMEGGGGGIINTASVLGLVGCAGAAAYCASKGAVVLLTKAMALDYAEQNIRVNCICPGSIDTPMLKGEMEAMGGEEKGRAFFAAKHPLNRICTPEEVGRAALFLASDDSSFVTGISLTVDGGRTAR